MYRRILVAIENSPADRTILTHVSELARLTGAELLLVHVADGWAARNFDQLKLRESEEMKSDRAYLEQLRSSLESRGFKVEARLGMGDPATELIKASEELGVDLIITDDGLDPAVRTLYSAEIECVETNEMDSGSADDPKRWARRPRPVPSSTPGSPSSEELRSSS